MTLDEKMAKLVCELEYVIGSECYNPNSYDGWNDIEGCDFRYPVCINCDMDTELKVRGHAQPKKPEYVKSLKYKFGSNHLFIGIGIINVLQYLEDRYGIDFNELERKTTD